MVFFFSISCLGKKKYGLLSIKVNILEFFFQEKSEIYKTFQMYFNTIILFVFFRVFLFFFQKSLFIFTIYLSVFIQ